MKDNRDKVEVEDLSLDKEGIDKEGVEEIDR